MDFYEWKLNLTWSSKWIICKRITESLCLWGSILVSLETIFVSQVLMCRLFHLVLYKKYTLQKFWKNFFGSLYHSNSTKTCLDEALRPVGGGVGCGGWGGVWRVGCTLPHPVIFLNPPSKLKPPNCKTTPPHWKVKPLSRQWFLEKTLKNRKLINTCVWLIKQHWKKMAKFHKKHNFLTWSIHNYVRKVKQFVRKCYITWLIDLANRLYDIEKFLISFYVMSY